MTTVVLRKYPNIPWPPSLTCRRDQRARIRRRECTACGASQVSAERRIRGWNDLEKDKWSELLRQTASTSPALSRLQAQSRPSWWPPHSEASEVYLWRPGVVSQSATSCERRARVPGKTAPQSGGKRTLFSGVHGGRSCWDIVIREQRNKRWGAPTVGCGVWAAGFVEKLQV
jgi:hypothetical protein